jgi:ubiquinone/menaquinone biosynthesis C-methylase UbiE
MGTGSGDNAIYLAQQGFAYYGIDISETAIRRAAEKAVQAGVTCEFTAGNATELPYADNMFNLVLDRGCFHSIPLQKRKAFIEGVNRVLRLGGKYLLICFGKIYSRRFESPSLLSSKDIQSLFTPLFKINYVKEIPNNRRGFGGLFLSLLMGKRP